MGGIIFGTIVLVIGGLFTLAEDHKTSKMSDQERWEYEWKKAKKKEDKVGIVRSHQIILVTFVVYIRKKYESIKAIGNI